MPQMVVSTHDRIEVFDIPNIVIPLNIMDETLSGVQLSWSDGNTRSEYEYSESSSDYDSTYTEMVSLVRSGNILRRVLRGIASARVDSYRYKIQYFNFNTSALIYEYIIPYDYSGTNNEYLNKCIVTTVPSITGKDAIYCVKQISTDSFVGVLHYIDIYNPINNIYRIINNIANTINNDLYYNHLFNISYLGDKISIAVTSGNQLLFGPIWYDSITLYEISPVCNENTMMLLYQNQDAISNVTFYGYSLCHGLSLYNVSDTLPYVNNRYRTFVGEGWCFGSFSGGFGNPWVSTGTYKYVEVVPPWKSVTSISSDTTFSLPLCSDSCTADFELLFNYTPKFDNDIAKYNTYKDTIYPQLTSSEVILALVPSEFLNMLLVLTYDSVLSTATLYTYDDIYYIRTTIISISSIMNEADVYDSNLWCSSLSLDQKDTVHNIMSHIGNDYKYCSLYKTHVDNSKITTIQQDYHISDDFAITKKVFPGDTVSSLSVIQLSNLNLDYPDHINYPGYYDVLILSVSKTQYRYCYIIPKFPLTYSKYSGFQNINTGEFLFTSGVIITDEYGNIPGSDISIVLKDADDNYYLGTAEFQESYEYLSSRYCTILDFTQNIVYGVTLKSYHPIICDYCSPYISLFLWTNINDVINHPIIPNVSDLLMLSYSNNFRYVEGVVNGFYCNKPTYYIATWESSNTYSPTLDLPSGLSFSSTETTIRVDIEDNTHINGILTISKCVNDTVIRDITITFGLDEYGNY